MKVWTAHTRPGRPPVLLREGFSVWAALFGPLWLLAWRAWVPAAMVFAVAALIGLASSGSIRLVLIWAVAWLLGLCGRDLVRWSLELRGYTLAHVVAARDADSAFARLLGARPDLIPFCAGRLPA